MARRRRIRASLCLCFITWRAEGRWKEKQTAGCSTTENNDRVKPKKRMSDGEKVKDEDGEERRRRRRKKKKEEDSENDK
jgi:hypothetical protein